LFFFLEFAILQNISIYLRKEFRGFVFQSSFLKFSVTISYPFLAQTYSITRPVKLDFSLVNEAEKTQENSQESFLSFEDTEM